MIALGVGIPLTGSLQCNFQSTSSSVQRRTLQSVYLKETLRKLFYCLALAAGLIGAAAAQATPLHGAVRSDDVAAVTNLLASASGPALREARDDAGRTPLLLATELNRVGIARALIKAGADVNARDARQDSPYLLAGAAGRLEILKMTLAHGAALGSTNRFGGTALIPAAERGHAETVRVLVEAGVDVDHVNRLGWTALLEAILLSDGGPAHQEIVRLLIAAGARVDLADADGVTPLQHAVRRGYAPIAATLRAAGAR
jgi:ankyrin repeat protein